MDAPHTAAMARDRVLGGHAADADDAVTRLVHVTYRAGLHPSVGGYATDAGWGCMFRCGQMVLASAIMSVLCGDGFAAASVDAQLFEDARTLAISLVDDVLPSEDTLRGAAGIHAAHTTGGLPAGEWHAPSAVARALTYLVDAVRPAGLSSVVLFDMTLYTGPLRARVRSGPLLVWLVARLGATRVPADALDVASRLVCAPCAVGVAAGVGSRALYVWGVSPADDLLVLDPHTVWPVGAESYVPARGAVQRVSPDSLDPCMVAGFVLRSEADVDAVLAVLAQIAPFSVVPGDPPCAPPPFRISSPDADGFESVSIP